MKFECEDCGFVVYQRQVKRICPNCDEMSIRRVVVLNGLEVLIKDDSKN